MTFMLALALSVAVQAPAAGAPSGRAWTRGPVVVFETSLGRIRVGLDKEKAPISTENFVSYVKSGHYDGTIFHRVIPNFMIQGGGFDKGMQQKKTRDPIRNEAEQALKAGLRNEIGTIAMARTSNPHSATAQFFINVNDNTFLNAGVRDAGYAVFGKVVSGLDIVGNIAKMPTGPGDVPREMVIIEKATVVPPKK